MLGIGGDTRTLNVERLKAGAVGVIGTRQRRRSAVLRQATARAETLLRAALLAGVSCAAPAYSFTNSDAFSINGAFAPTFTNTGNGGVMSFNNASTAGNAIIITNSGAISTTIARAAMRNSSPARAAPSISPTLRQRGRHADGHRHHWRAERRRRWDRRAWQFDRHTPRRGRCQL